MKTVALRPITVNAAASPAGDAMPFSPVASLARVASLTTPMRIFLRHLELILTFLGLLLTFVISAGLIVPVKDHWLVAAVVASVVAFVHGLIFWLVRRRQRRIREQVIAEIQPMLQDVICNNLAIIRLQSDLGRTDPAFNEIEHSIESISLALRELSDESLRRWQVRYQHSPSSA